MRQKVFLSKTRRNDICAAERQQKTNTEKETAEIQQEIENKLRQLSERTEQLNTREFEINKKSDAITKDYERVASLTVAQAREELFRIVEEKKRQAVEWDDRYNNEKGGNLGTDGSVSYMFERKGLIILNKV